MSETHQYSTIVRLDHVVWIRAAGCVWIVILMILEITYSPFFKCEMKEINDEEGANISETEVFQDIAEL